MDLLKELAKIIAYLGSINYKHMSRKYFHGVRTSRKSYHKETRLMSKLARENWHDGDIRKQELKTRR